MLRVELDVNGAVEPLAIECQECESLTSAHEFAKRNYAMAVDVLFATGYRFKDKAYAALKNAVEETRAQWEIAHAQFDRHKRSSHQALRATHSSKANTTTGSRARST
jgi:hypothetical protein